MPTRAELERAVIEAAKAWRAADTYPPPGPIVAVLMRAVTGLNDFERSQAAAGISEGVAWNTIAVGDQVKGKTGFYPVVGTLALTGGRTRLTINVRGDHKTVTRPTEAEPTATVKRGPDGTAVQTFVDVFSSRGN